MLNQIDINKDASTILNDALANTDAKTYSEVIIAMQDFADLLVKQNSRLKFELGTAVKFLKEFKAKQYPETTNSFVDDFIHKHRSVK